MKYLDRYPAVVPFFAAAGLFALFQAAFLVWRSQGFGSAELTAGMFRLGIFAGLLTVLALFPVALLARRWLPAWRPDSRTLGDRRETSWTVFLVPVAAIAAWMAADLWAAGPLVPPALEPLVEVAVAAAAGLAAFWLRPPERLRRAAALTAPAVLVLAFLPIWPVPAGGAGAESEAAPPADAAPAGERPDVVLVSIDTLRADRLGAYGGVGLTPEIDRVAGEGVVFERVLASSPWTIPSVASMLTGLPSARHGAGLALGSGPTVLRSPLDGEHVTLAERFRAAGYRTRAVAANGFLNAEGGFAQGFDVLDNPLQRAMFAIFLRDIPLVRLVLGLIPTERWGDFRAQGVTDRALEWLAEDGDEPLFLWLHYIDPHTPFQADPADLDVGAWMAEMHQTQPEVRDDGSVVGEVFAATSHVRGGMLWLDAADKRRLEEHYDGEVRYVDQEVGRLFEALRERDARRRVIAAVTADHGEEFWDHGHFEHGHDYYREVTRVPLVFWGPGEVPAGRTVDALAGLVDVAPTLLELAGLEPPPAAAADEGRSLAALWDDGDPPAAEAPEAATPPRFAGGNLYGLPSAMIEDGPWRFILRATGTVELYDAESDPEERHNLAVEHPEVVERYREALAPRLEIFLAGGSGEGVKDLAPETVKALKSLGYL